MNRIEILCSSHGFGHLARQLAVAEALLERGETPRVWTAAPATLVRDYLPSIEVVEARLDVGLVQRDSLHEDLPATVEALAERTSDPAVDNLAYRLSGADLAIVDIAPTALEACRRAGVPAVAVGNFDWAWIYSQLPGLQEYAELFARWQAPHPAIQLEPGPPLHGFRSVRSAGVVGRWRPALRPEGCDDIAVLVSFGGFGLDALDAALPELPGVTWVLAPPMQHLDRPDCVFVEGTSYPALVGGCDLVLTKPGYGIYSECALAGTPVVALRRPGFPEASYLERAFAQRGDRLLAAGTDDLPALKAELADSVRELAGQRRPPAAKDGARKVVDLALEMAGRAPAAPSLDLSVTSRA